LALYQDAQTRWRGSARDKQAQLSVLPWREKGKGRVIEQKDNPQLSTKKKRRRSWVEGVSDI